VRELIPFRWPVEWKDPSRLELLKGTPVNCLVGTAKPPFPLGDLPYIQLDSENPPPGIAIREGVWPSVLAATKKEGSAAGPTGDAWVDSNAWVIRLGQVMEPGKMVWVTHDPPADNAGIVPASFIKPVAEAEAFGGHWVISLNREFREGLENRAAAALSAWGRMMAAHRFFAAHRAWRTWQPAAVLGVISTFSGEGEMLSREFLNLAPRRHLAYRAMLATSAVKTPFDGLKAIVYLENQPPEGELLARLMSFARSGGLLVGPKGIAQVAGGKRMAEHTVASLGAGRVAVPLQPWDDPFSLVAQVHVLLGHREDIVRIWNASSTDTFPLVDPARRKLVVHLIPYASEPTPPVTVGVGRLGRSARVIGLESEAPAKLMKGPLGIEVAVGPIADYAAVEVEL
jgi:hypothetical protein